MMPSPAGDIRYLFKRYVLPRRGIIVHFLKAFLSFLAIALILEAVVFNFNSLASSSYDTIDLDRKIDLRQNSEGLYLLTEAKHSIEFKDLNTEVHNLGIFFETSQPAQNVPIKIQFTDEAHLTYFDSTDYTVGIPVIDVSTWSVASQYIKLNATGRITNLSITVGGDDVSYPLYLKTVAINVHEPFAFNWLRFIAAFGILLLIFCFRPGSAIYRIGMKEYPRGSRAAIIGAVLVECSLAAAFTLFGSNLVGVATSFYNPGEWDGVSIINTFEVGGDNAQQYAELAKSFTEGRLYLDEEPPDWLVEMNDPYDRGARDELEKQTGESYLFDVAFFEGRYYVYFGVVPVLLFYLPFFLLTGSNFPTAIGVLIAVVFFIAGCSALLDRFARHHFKRVSLGLYLVMQTALVTGCGVLYLLKFPTFYSLPLACGLAFSVWGLYFWMKGRSSRKDPRICYAAGSLCMALILGCRPQLMMLSLVAIPIFWRRFITSRHIATREGILEFVCLILPYVVVAIGIMAYNYGRFGSPTDFGANYNLTVNDMTQRGWVMGRFAPAFFAYFLQTPNLVGTFPFIQPVDFSTTYMGQTIREATFGGIFACYPILWILLFALPIARLRNSQRETHTITGVILVMVFSGIVVAMVDAQMAGILQRYYADFSFMFFASIVLLVFIVNENVDFGPAFVRHRRPRFRLRGGMSGIRSCIAERRELARRRREELVLRKEVLANRLMPRGLLLLVAFGVVYSVLLCFVPEIGWYSDIYPWAYQGVLEAIQFWK